jgi:hypothetical protein
MDRESLGKPLRDREAEAPIVSYAGHERALAPEIDRQHPAIPAECEICEGRSIASLS